MPDLGVAGRVAQRRRISGHNYDNYLQAAFHSWRHRLTRYAEVFTEGDRPERYDVVEELTERYVIAHLRPASGKKGERSNL